MIEVDVPQEPLTFSYWTDPLCVWAYVCQPKLENVMGTYGDNVTCQQRMIPVFTSMQRRFAKGGAWEGKDGTARREATVRIATNMGFDNVTGEVWEKDMPTSSMPAAMAFCGVSLLEERGDVAQGASARYVDGLRRAFFERNQNTARRQVQLALAEELDVAPDKLAATLDDGTALARLFEDYEDKEKHKLRGSPSWVFDNGRSVLFGNVAAGVVHGVVEELLYGKHPGCTWCG